MQEGPNRPQPQQLSLDHKTTAVLVLDLSTRCHDPKEVCFQLMEPLGGFLERARQCSVPVLYTVSASGKGTPLSEVAEPLKRRATEPVLYPDAFDKFMGGELRDALDRVGCRSLVIAGSATNFAVLYTATTAARVYRYDVIIPLDGVNAKRQYEHEYAIHQMTILPASANKQFRFTNLDGISFR
jgi:nicotinamidase-related amidase